MSVPHAAPRRPAAARLAVAALAALAGLAACRAGQVLEPCPGLEVAVLQLVAVRTAAACAGDTAPADGDDACAAANEPAVRCQLDRPVPACCFDLLFPRSFSFEATIAYGPGDAAAFCRPVPGASPYVGTRTPVAGGDQLSVSLDTSGAVLSSCSATCAVTVAHQVSGLIARDAAGAVTGFTGESVEVASATPDATCTPCTAPCQATWALSVPPPPP